MKKRLILFVSMFLTCFFLNAQIKRDFDGVILGKATKSDVKSYLAKKGYHYEIMEDGNAIQSRNEVSFGGVLWSGVYYSFCKETLYRVTYTKIVQDKEKDLKRKYKELRENLYKKYVKRIPQDNSNDYKPETKIKDKSTLIKLSIHRHKTRPYILYLKLTYLDLNLEKRKEQEEINDL